MWFYRRWHKRDWLVLNLLYIGRWLECMMLHALQAYSTQNLPKLETTHSFYNPMHKNTVNCYVAVPAMGLNKCIILDEFFILPPTIHSILEPLSKHPLWSLQRNLICTQKSFSFKHKNTYLFLQILPRALIAIWWSPLLLHSFLHHSSNATYTYNGLGSFPSTRIVF